MADDFEDITGSPPAEQSPAIQTFQDAFTHPVAQEWSEEVGARLNDYFTRRQIADENIAAGETFVQDMESFKSGLVQGVQKDPHFVYTAMDIVPPTIDAFGRALPEFPGDEHATNLTSHIQGEIATAAITKMAEVNAHAARTMLGDERIKSLLGENAQALHTYINSQETARQIDYQAEVEALQAQAALKADVVAVEKLSNLVNPASNTVQFPAQWNQSVLADPNIPPPVKAGLINTYDHLRRNGDIERSDPFVITDAIRRAANGEPPPAGEIAQRIGKDLTLSDGLSLMRRLSISPAAHAEAQNIQQTLDAVREQIAPIDSGAAGAAAYGRFVNWFLPEYMRQGPSSLNPRADNWMLNPEVPGNPIARFQPTGDDLVGIEQLANRANRAIRPSLGQIFSGGREHTAPVYEAPKGYQYDAGGNLVPTPVEMGAKGPFYGVERPYTDQMVNPPGVDKDAAGHPLVQINTDSGPKWVSPQELRQQHRGPRPIAPPPLSEEEQQTFQNTGRIPTRGVRSPRRKR